MASFTTYSDIIDDKILEWREKIQLLKHISSKSPKNIQAQKKWQISQLLASIEMASVRLHDLDSHENISNTLVIKNEILLIFDSIDKKLHVTEPSEPFML